MVKVISLFIVSLLASSAALAQGQCYSLARTYYEQLYCEARARGHGSTLPGFYDFQRNSEMTQALLLKGPARKLGVDLKMPSGKATSAGTRSGPARLLPTTGARVSQASCAMSVGKIDCGGRQFEFQSNRNNRQLAEQALGESNSMAMPTYDGDYDNNETVNAYLLVAYQHYLDKMLLIGLGESTMAYGNFAYLFQDLRKKGVDFSGRFEKMYAYLKQDKQQLAVKQNSNPPMQLGLGDCFPLPNYWVCERARKNYVFKSVN